MTDLSGPAESANRVTLWRAIAAGVGVILLVGLVIAAFVLRGDGSATAAGSPTSPTGSPDPTDTPSGSATSAANPDSTPSPTAEPIAGWQGRPIPVAGAGTERVHAVTAAAGGFVAVGVNYPEGAPFLVAVPQEGRVWHSTDGRLWEDITPADTFADAFLNDVFTAADDALIAVGSVAEGDIGRPAAWESADGLGWSPTTWPFSDNGSVTELEAGARGYVALVSAGAEQHVWLSSDGRTWDVVLSAGPGESLLDIGAGDDGFVVIGMRGEGVAIEPFAAASSDGLTWIEATVPPLGASSVVARGGDWIASGRVDGVDILGAGGGSGCLADPPDERLWSSANGLEWSEVGTIPWTGDVIEAECWYVDAELHAPGQWLISSTRASPGPCCDIILTPDEQRVSPDGQSWELLPFPSADRESGVLGSSVNDAIADGEMLILVGESGLQAAFWFNEAP